MIRIPVWLNDEKIGEVQITRTFTDRTHPGVHRYVWYLRTWTEDGRDHTESSIMDHRESDGALVLIRKVLQACEHVELYAPPTSHPASRRVTPTGEPTWD